MLATSLQHAAESGVGKFDDDCSELRRLVGRSATDQAALLAGKSSFEVDEDFMRRLAYRAAVKRQIERDLQAQARCQNCGADTASAAAAGVRGRDHQLQVRDLDTRRWCAHCGFQLDHSQRLTLGWIEDDSEGALRKRARRDCAEAAWQQRLADEVREAAEAGEALSGERLRASLEGPGDREGEALLHSLLLANLECAPEESDAEEAEDYGSPGYSPSEADSQQQSPGDWTEDDEPVPVTGPTEQEARQRQRDLDHAIRANTVHTLSKTYVARVEEGCEENMEETARALVVTCRAQGVLPPEGVLQDAKVQPRHLKGRRQTVPCFTGLTTQGREALAACLPPGPLRDWAQRCFAGLMDHFQHKTTRLWRYYAAYVLAAMWQALVALGEPVPPLAEWVKRYAPRVHRLVRSEGASEGQVFEGGMLRTVCQHLTTGRARPEPCWRYDVFDEVLALALGHWDRILTPNNLALPLFVRDTLQPDDPEEAARWGPWWTAARARLRATLDHWRPARPAVEAASQALQTAAREPQRPAWAPHVPWAGQQAFERARALEAVVRKAPPGLPLALQGPPQRLRGLAQVLDTHSAAEAAKRRNARHQRALVIRTLAAALFVRVARGLAAPEWRSCLSRFQAVICPTAERLCEDWGIREETLRSAHATWDYLDHWVNLP